MRNITHEVLDAWVPVEEVALRESLGRALAVTYAGLLIAGAAAFASYRLLVVADPGTVIIVAVLLIIPVALIPQIAPSMPLPVLRWFVVGLVVVHGALTGAGFALLHSLMDTTIVLQTLALLVLMLLVTPPAGLLGLFGGAPERGVILLIGMTLLLFWAGTTFLGWPWVVPFVAEGEVFQPLVPPPDWWGFGRGMLVRAIPALFLVLALTACAREAVDAWRLSRLRLDGGLLPGAGLGVAALFTGIIPMLVVLMVLILGSRGSGSRERSS
ncbi:MAG: hypothetical protein PVF68_13115 [Acidobacteriota bacterium]|jgi:hypothetical protein